MQPHKARQYLKVAESFALMSKDPSSRVGCVVLNSQTFSVRSVGYNGFPRGVDETIASRWDRETKLRFISHSEQNAIAQAAREGISLENSTMVCTMFPCCECAKSIIQAGIKKVVTREPTGDLLSRWEASFDISTTMFREAGVVVQFVKDVQ